MIVQTIEHVAKYYLFICYNNIETSWIIYLLARWTRAANCSYQPSWTPSCLSFKKQAHIDKITTNTARSQSHTKKHPRVPTINKTGIPFRTRYIHTHACEQLVAKEMEMVPSYWIFFFSSHRVNTVNNSRARTKTKSYQAWTSRLFTVCV